MPQGFQAFYPKRLRSSHSVEHLPPTPLNHSPISPLSLPNPSLTPPSPLPHPCPNPSPPPPQSPCPPVLCPALPRPSTTPVLCPAPPPSHLLHQYRGVQAAACATSPCDLPLPQPCLHFLSSRQQGRHAVVEPGQTLASIHCDYGEGGHQNAISIWGRARQRPAGDKRQDQQ
jgi:hypothetical protein